MLNDHIAGLDPASITSKAKETTLEKPNPVDVGDFQKAMSQDSKGAHCDSKECGVVDKGGAADGDKKSGEKEDGNPMEKILMMLMELLTMLTKMMKEENGSEGDSDGESKKGAEAAGGAGKGSGSSETGKGGGSSAAGDTGKASEASKGAENKVSAGDGQIPQPTEHKQSFELGGKQVTVGGDGSASPAEVQQTKDTLTNLYENSNNFKEMIDSSPNESFDVSVGKRDDNMSWGNEDGRVFMNINSIDPNSGDGFESLMAHEMGHAGADMEHGAEMKQFEQTVAKEA
ncbi:MAG: hypothetical protein KAH00_02435 [Cocleimonas sp.]|nr:hypothetical protein [Cocleimonas sp.]